MKALLAAAMVLALESPTPRVDLLNREWRPATQQSLKPMHIEPYHYRCIQANTNDAIIVLEPIEEGGKPIGPIMCVNCRCEGEK